MSFVPFGDTSAWSDSQAVDADPGDIIANAMKKERVIRDIVAAQEDLKTLLSRIKTVQGEVDKLTSGNQTLQMYIDNLTKQLARR
ncbi:hypothetical protein JB92DRAFT_2892708 [Gautieria morchelliformis]|nr:hypothetical protein JB92DRAFT_2892708 [Gautieria morchelliformis]